MNVLVYSSWYPSKSNAVMGVFVKEQVKALKSVGVNPIVFYPYDKSIEKDKLVCSVEDGIKTYRANTDYLKNSLVSRINSILKSFKYLEKIFSDNVIDIIHCHVCYPAGFVAMFYKHKYKKRYVITEHMSTVKDFSSKLYNKLLYDLAYKNAERVITVSKFLSDSLMECGYKFKSEVIGNVVDCSDVVDDENNNSRSKEISILFIGSMDSSEVKGLQYFIPALANYIKSNPKDHIKFTAIGDGAKRLDYEKLCERLKITDNCLFCGIVKKEEINTYIRKCDFLVLPSIKETFGCVVIEAMAQGKPVLCTKCGGPQEFVNDNLGILVESKNVEALEQGLKSMINNYDRFDSQAIKNYAVNNYSYEAIGSKLLKVYSELI